MQTQTNLVFALNISLFSRCVVDHISSSLECKEYRKGNFHPLLSLYPLQTTQLCFLLIYILQSPQRSPGICTNGQMEQTLEDNNKYTYVTITLRSKTPNTIFFNNIPISKTNCVRYVEFYLDTSLTWNRNI